METVKYAVKRIIHLLIFPCMNDISSETLQIILGMVA